MRSIALLVALAAGTTACSGADNDIRLNTLGFLPDQAKAATILTTSVRPFRVEPAEGGAALVSGTTGEPKTNADTGETVAVADLSALKTPGRYRLVVDGIGRSAPFAVVADLYAAPFRTVTRAFYLWRCGCAVQGEHEGTTFAHAACHTEDAWLDQVGRPGERIDATGGWHDAGDYNKYVVNAAITMGLMGFAWDLFPKRAGADLGLPDRRAGTPDLLTEMRYEMDWLLKMQLADGSVYERVSTVGFGGFVMPEAEKTKRFVSRPSSASTAAFAAMAAQMTRLMKPCDRAYADRCLTAARNAWAWCEAHPATVERDKKSFTTGGYDAGDGSFRLWAAAELWAATGEAPFLAAVHARLAKTRPAIQMEFNWPDVRNLAAVTWLLAPHDGRDTGLAMQVSKELTAAADKLVANAASHAYGRPMNSYGWGCNGTVANTTFVLAAADRIAPSPRYRATALDAVGHLFGRNAHGRSYVTGLGTNPPRFPHDRRCGKAPGSTPWPGYLVGGPFRHSKAAKDSPPALGWIDVQGSYETNEIAINAGLVFALAWLTPETGR